MASNSTKFDSVIKNVLLEALIEKFFSVKDIFNPDMRKFAQNEGGNVSNISSLSNQESKAEVQKK